MLAKSLSRVATKLDCIHEGVTGAIIFGEQVGRVVSVHGVQLSYTGTGTVFVYQGSDIMFQMDLPTPSGIFILEQYFNIRAFGSWSTSVFTSGFDSVKLNAQFEIEQIAGR